MPVSPQYPGADASAALAQQQQPAPPYRGDRPPMPILRRSDHVFDIPPAPNNEEHPNRAGANEEYPNLEGQNPEGWNDEHPDRRGEQHPVHQPGAQNP